MPEFLLELSAADEELGFAEQYDVSQGANRKPGEVDDIRGCAYCGGLGHRITHCPKLEAEQNKAAVGMSRKDYLSFADY